MGFDPQAYGVEVAKILVLSGDGHRLIPLVCDARAKVPAPKFDSGLFADAAHPASALAGIWVYLSHFEKAHEIAQDDPSAEGSFWHAILHRQEPDDFNSGYWFRRVGKDHPVYRPLAEAAAEIASRNPGSGFPVATSWDPHAFVEYCSAARSKPGSLQERVALEVQRAEWQLLFDHCARTNSRPDRSRKAD
jgi:hypothetical protein